MTRMTALLERNEHFARTYLAALGAPAQQLLIVSCLDHRVDPANVLRPAARRRVRHPQRWRRVTQAVISDIAYLALLSELLFSNPDDRTVFEVAVVHHTQCGAGLLADSRFRRQAASATGMSEPELEATTVTDPEITVKADAERLLASALLSPKVSVSGHVYDIAAGRLTTTVDARYPDSDWPAA